MKITLYVNKQLFNYDPSEEDITSFIMEVQVELKNEFSDYTIYVIRVPEHHEATCDIEQPEFSDDMFIQVMRLAREVAESCNY